ncbi:TraX family protein [[Clostridium] hylemonae]|uniref:Protein TraX n=1 Tax=[Clostridium] hylemonae DSM 15053 TaxID=553973 RepID=C0C385_9FIRM|nr:TraX family protein [[Clostridium] hylemonae]EEG73261.1 protein TraX [[Clostridium] hylemonae DSM 15053]QEK17350.1 hypothetical protein LAJLEIBI_01359 [[Clostridium] hylemonae DSM 15053]BDF04356.1 conjugal transfer protein TraX [[Clostridium] hylemonae]
MEWIRNKIGLTSFQLKCIAIISMVIDHTGAILYPDEMIFRYIGRIAFPIFCFLLVEGFCHTGNVYRYMRRMLVFAFVSEIPYDLAFQGRILEFGHQNVFFTLFLGVILMWALQRAGEWPEKAAEIVLVMWIAGILKTDYSYTGILLIAVFYLLRDGLWIKLAAGTAWCFIWNGFVQKYGALAMIPVALYNGERGRSMKYFFYAFYPLHLLILYGISRWMI